MYQKISGVTISIGAYALHRDHGVGKDNMKIPTRYYYCR